MMDKKIVMQLYKNELEKNLEDLRVSYESAKTDVKQAEGRMVTRYDSMRTEMAWVANSMLAEVMGAEEALKLMEMPNLVNVGDVVTVRIRKGEQDVYSETFCISNFAENSSGIMYISPGEPKALSCLGQSADKLVEVQEGNETYTMQIAGFEKAANGEVVIGINTLAALQESGYEEEWYLVTGSHGGFFLELDDEQEVVAVSVKAPLAQAMLGKKTGEEVTLVQGGNKRVLTVTQIL